MRESLCPQGFFETIFKPPQSSIRLGVITKPYGVFPSFPGGAIFSDDKETLLNTAASALLIA